MSRLNDLLRQLENKDPALARDLREEYDALADRRAFGLNFERHVPEAVRFPGRPVRRGDKVHILPKRGENPTVENAHLWRVLAINRNLEAPMASLEAINGEGTPEVEVEELVVVAEFRDPIYPGLASRSRIERGGDKPFHTVINAENYHALQALLFTHRESVDCVYIDPPYNTGAKDWRYNNNYVETDDIYRHSKWLAFMERRLLLAKELLNPDGSALIVTIDEKEYLRLGMLLEQIFDDARIQMVTSVINATGVIRSTEFTRTNEYIFFITVGDRPIRPESTSDERVELLWNLLQRREDASRRHGPTPRLDQFYPIYVNQQSSRIEAIGASLPLDADRRSVPDRPNCDTVFPLKPDGTEMVWGLTPSSLQRNLDLGYVRVKSSRGKHSVYYLTSGKIRDLQNGEAEIVGHRDDGSVIAVNARGQRKMPESSWDRPSHNAQSHGTKLLSRFLPGRKFPFPKSLYAVEDCLRFFVGDNPDAVIVDFFGGSGTTSHATMRLNRADGGRRQSILISNNEVAADEQQALRAEGRQPGDREWEARGIFEHVTQPRLCAATTGIAPDGSQANGEYKYAPVEGFSEGFDENVEFFEMKYGSSLRVTGHREFATVAPLLWMRAGSRGRRIDDLTAGWDVADTYGVIADLDQSDVFLKAVAAAGEDLTIAYVITDEDRLFQSVVRELPAHVEAVRLYEAYLRNFELEAGRTAQ